MLSLKIAIDIEMGGMHTHARPFQTLSGFFNQLVVD
jgi:hypothetical protein